MPDEPMTLIERLRNPTYVTNPSGGGALLDASATIRDMRLAALLIEAHLRRSGLDGMTLDEAKSLRDKLDEKIAGF